MSIFISCGETSGDMLAGHMIRKLKERQPELMVLGNGGEQMTQAGCKLIFDVVNASSIGFVEPLIRIPYFLNVLRKTKRVIIKMKIKVVVIIDHQGFNIPLAKWCKSKNIKVISVIAPQFWLWGRKKSAENFVKTCHKVLCIFEKEFDFYKRISSKKVTFIGHPLASVLPKKKILNEQIIGLFPGSRQQEIDYCLPLMMGVAKCLFNENPHRSIKLAVARTELMGHIRQQLETHDLPIELTTDSKQLIAEAQASLVTSGTVSLEHALVGTPCVVVYRFSTISFWVARWLVQKKLQENCHGFIALPNILAEKEICPELLQDQATIKNATDKLQLILNDDDYFNRITAAFKGIQAQLRTDKDPFQLVVDEILTIEDFNSGSQIQIT